MRPTFAAVMRLFTVCIFILLTVAVRAQDAADKPTIPQKPKASFVSNAIFQFDNRTERYYDVKARMNGLKIGLEYYKRVRIGLGIYGNINYYQINSPLRDIRYPVTARFSYYTLFMELVTYRSFRWELSPSIALGKGMLLTNTYDLTTPVPVVTARDTFSNNNLYDIAFNTQFKVFPWFAVGLGVGYRSVDIRQNPTYSPPFTAAYYDVKFKLLLGYLFKDIFKPEKIQAEKDYYQYRKQKRHRNFKSLFQ